MSSVSIIGCGHNSLVTSIYLAKYGHDVTIYEQNAVAGGLCKNEKIIKDSIFSKFASWYGMFHPQIIEDLNLGNYIKRIECELSEVILTDNGDYFCGDLDIPFGKIDDPLTIENVKLFWHDMTLAAGLLKDFLIIENPQQEDFLSALEKINFQILPPNFIKLSLVDLVTKIFGDQNEIASMLSTGAFYHPCQEGSTYGLLYAMTGQWSRIEGGLGRITEILYQKAIQCGVKFKFNSRCLKLNYTDKGISSIECESAPSHSPDITILGTDGYAARKLLPELFTDEPTHVSGTAMFHVVLKKDPNFPALHKLTSLPTTICLTRSIPDLKESYYHYKNGEYFSNSIISLLPLGQNDEGSPMLIGQVHFAPESVDDKETYTKSIINLVEKNYPSFREDIQEIVFTLPQDIAANFGQDKINCFHTDLIWEKCMEKRSHIFGAGPTTPIKNVYICSSLIHPGGTVSGMPGYRCAQAILKKLKPV